MANSRKKHKGLITESLEGIADSLGLLIGSGLESIVTLGSAPADFITEALKPRKKRRGS